MILFKQVEDLQTYLKPLRKNGRKIGFVPTMGALHQGHLSLIQRSKQENDFTVCSIFVNPTQFNDNDDLKKYPRTAGKDIGMLTAEGNDVLFMPNVEDVYPKNLDTKLNLNLGQLDKVMEGEFRPGHFDGMAQVVKRLLDIVEPNNLYMGQKDFQQFSIVKHMIATLNLSTNLNMCDIIRENDGLAMSSRNVRLTEENRAKAPIIYETLTTAKKMKAANSPKEIMDWAKQKLSKSGFKLEYFDIVDGSTLQPIATFEETDFPVACVALWAGEIRLIDNILF